MEGINSYFVQHRASQGCFILAIPVTMGKNLGRRMRLKAANAKLNGDVADVVLHKASYCLHFFKLRVFPCRQECDLLFYLGRGFHSSGYQLVLPVSQIAPLREAVCRFSAGRKESDDHLSSDSLPWGHKGFVADTFYVTYCPLPQITGCVRGLNFSVIQPRRLELPSRRQLQRVVTLAYGIVLLEVPGVLQIKWPLLHFVFVANDIAWFRSRNRQHLKFDVADHFNVAIRCTFDRIFIFHFIIFALRGNAPAVKTPEFAPRI